MAKEIDMGDVPPEYFIGAVGQLVLRALAADRVAILVKRDDGALTVVSPGALNHVPALELVSSLVETWSDSQIDEFLEFLKSKEQEWAT